MVTTKDDYVNAIKKIQEKYPEAADVFGMYLCLEILTVTTTILIYYKDKFVERVMPKFNDVRILNAWAKGLHVFYLIKYRNP